MEESKATHVLVTYRSQNCEMLFRADDGVCIGQRKNETVLFGEEPNKKCSRVFIDGAHATKWLRNYAGKDVVDASLGLAAVIEDRDGEPIIQLPPDAIDLPRLGVNPLRN